MEFFEAIEKRYSHRGAYTAQPVPRGHLEQILDAGIRAPSGGNAQTTSFVGVLDPALMAQLAAIVPSRALSTAPAAIVVLSRYNEAYPGKSFEFEDYGAATENLLLAITALGYASVWIDGQVRDAGRNTALAKLLQVPSGHTVRAVLPLGVPAEAGCQRPRQPFTERARIL